MLIFVPLAISSVHNQSKVSALDKEVRKLQDQEFDITAKNQELKDSLAFVESSDFQETLSKTRLNMQKSGEVVYTFPSAPVSQSASVAGAGTGVEEQEIKFLPVTWAGNWLSWASYLTLSHEK